MLAPDGEDCPYDDWLGEESTAPGIQADHVVIGGIQPTYDPLSLRGNARHVEAGGMRLIDGIDPNAPVHGVFVVRSVTGPCAGDPPTSSRGCTAWRVLARVADVTSPGPSASPRSVAPTPTTAPPATPIVSPEPALPTLRNGSDRGWERALHGRPDRGPDRARARATSPADTLSTSGSSATARTAAASRPARSRTRSNRTAPSA